MWEDSIKADLKETGNDGVNWIHLGQNRVLWWTMNIVMDKAGNFLTS
jgi:hypothetical protein